MTNKVIRLIQVMALVAAGVVLGAKTAGYHQAASHVHEKLQGFQAAATHTVSVSESPLIMKAASLLSCTSADGTTPEALPDRRVLVLVAGDQELTATADESAMETWRSLATRVPWNASSQLWLVSVSQSATPLPGLEGASIKRCTVRDPKQFVQMTGISQTPTAALFRGADLWLFASGATGSVTQAQFERHLTDAREPKPRTPFIADKAGRAIWREPKPAPATSR